MALLWLSWGLHGEVCIPLFPSWIPRSGKRRERPAGRPLSPAAQWLPPFHHKGKLRPSWGAFCSGISQMSSGLTVLIRHLENLAGSPLNYPWCLRMLSGVLPFLPSFRASSFQCVTICTPWRGPGGETTLPNFEGPGVSISHQTQYGHHRVMGRARKIRQWGIALLVGLYCTA